MLAPKSVMVGVLVRWVGCPPVAPGVGALFSPLCLPLLRVVAVVAPARPLSLALLSLGGVLWSLFSPSFSLACSLVCPSPSPPCCAAPAPPRSRPGSCPGLAASWPPAFCAAPPPPPAWSPSPSPCLALCPRWSFGCPRPPPASARAPRSFARAVRPGSLAPVRLPCCPLSRFRPGFRPSGGCSGFLRSWPGLRFPVRVALVCALPGFLGLPCWPLAPAPGPPLVPLVLRVRPRRLVLVPSRRVRLCSPVGAPPGRLRPGPPVPGPVVCLGPGPPRFLPGLRFLPGRASARLRRPPLSAAPARLFWPGLPGRLGVLVSSPPPGGAAAARPVAFVGSRSLPGSAACLVSAAARAAASRGLVSVGSGPGRGFSSWVLAGAPAAWVFAPSFAGAGALPARAAALVRGCASLLAFPAVPCPPGVVPAHSWRSGSPPSGCWSEIALAAGLGRPVLLVGLAVGSADLPAWPGGSWRGFRRPLAGLPVRCWAWVPAQVPLPTRPLVDGAPTAPEVRT